MMRKSCLDCVRKHLAQAHVLLDEAALGYPSHRWLAIGHLAEAESESLQRFSILAIKIREHRVALIENPDYDPPLLTMIENITSLEDNDNEIEIRNKTSGGI